MQINRHNYEDFFLLALDGELSAEERASLDLFLTENPDLLPEFEMLKQTVLPADEVRFDKSLLFKRAALPEGLQDDILSYADGELNDEDEKAVKQLLFENADAADFRRSLKLATLPADEVFCPFKEELYRREPARVLPMKFLMRAAAVLILLFGTWLVYNRVNSAKQDSTEMGDAVAVNDQGAKNKEQGPRNNEQQATGNEQQVMSDSKQADTQFAKGNDQRTTEQRSTVNGQRFTNNEQRTITDNRQPSTNIARIDPQPAPVIREEEQQVVPEEIIKNERSIPALAVNNKENENVAIPANTIAYLDEGSSENKILYMDESNLKRSKAGGLFKKVKRFVSRAAEIRPGKSFGIAALKFGPDN